MSTCPYCSAPVRDPASQVCPACGKSLDAAEAATLASFPPAGNDSLSDDDATEVIRQSALERAQGKRAPMFGTVDLAEALDAFIADETAQKRDDLHQTRNSDPVGPAFRQTHVTGAPAEGENHSDNYATRNTHATLAPEFRQTALRVSQLWSTSVQPGDKPRHSLKSAEPNALDSTPSGSEISSANLAIHRRRVAKKDLPGAPPDYELLDVLGEGGMGVVYSARQTSVDRTIALKMLKSKSANTLEARGKFLAEAAVTGDLDHPNIVPIYDLGQNEDGSLFYAMKRVRGQPWLDVMFQRSEQENLETLMRIADAVAFAHAHGVIHRDLKPENVMLGEFGEVLVMDWGLAVGVDRKSKASTFTKVDSVGGTPAYMAPEMAGGPLHAVDKHSDIYLLGGMLWELLTGNTPHTGRTVMACLMAAGINAITPTEKKGELVDIALKAMATDPADRYPTVKAFQDAIRSYQSHLLSIGLSTEAQKHLDLARKSKKYDDYSRASFGFEQALSSWKDNNAARIGRSVSQFEYAQAALENRDLDLADSLLDRTDKSHGALIPLVAAARADREKKQRQLRLQSQLLWTSVLTIMLVLAGSAYAIYGKYIEAENARAAADLAAKAEEKAKDAALAAAAAEKTAKEAAETARQKEETARKKEAEQRQAAERAEEAALAAKKNEEAQRVIADENAKQARLARDDAEYEGYVAKIGLASAKVDQNSFLYANELLASCREDLRKWEWGRIKYLIERDDGSFSQDAPVKSVAYGPGGKTIFTAGIDGRAIQWDVAAKKPLHVFEHGQSIWSLAVTPDGALLATGGADGLVKLWKTADASPAGELSGHRDAVLSLAFSKKGERLASGSRDATARVWDVAGRKPLIGFGGRSYGHGLDVWSAAWSPDERLLVTASEDGLVLLWRADRPLFADDLKDQGIAELEPESPLVGVPRGEKLAEYKGHGGPVSTAIFSVDGKCVISGGFDKDLHIWYAEIFRDNTTFTPLPLFGELLIKLAGHSNRIWSARLLPEPKRMGDDAGLTRARLVTSADDNTVRTWGLSSRNVERKLDNGAIKKDFPKYNPPEIGEAFRGHSGRIRSVDLSTDDPRPLSGSDDGTAKLWRVGRFREENVTPTKEIVLTFAPSHDGKTLLAGCTDRAVRLLDAKDHRELAVLDEGNRDVVTAIDVSPDGARMLAADATGQLFVWDTKTSAELLSIAAHVGDPQFSRPTAAVFSPDGRYILTGGADRFVRLWDAQSGEKIREFQAHGQPVSAVAFSPDMKFLVSGDDIGTLFVHDFEGKTPSRSSLAASRRRQANVNIIEHGTVPITGLHVFKNGEVASSSVDQSVGLWSLANFQQRASLGVASPGDTTIEVRAMAVSPDESRLLTGSSDGVVRLWDVKAAKLIKALPGHTQPVLSVTFTPDGQGALSSSLDRTLIRWELETGKFTQTPPVTYRETTLVKFSPQGENLLTADQDVVTWRTAKGEMIFNVVRHGLLEAVGYTADGREAITAGSDAGVKIWNLETKRVVRRLSETHAGSLHSMDFWPKTTKQNAEGDSLLIATAGGDKLVRLWDGRKQTLLREFKGHASRVNGVAMWPNGKQIASCSTDGTTRVWNVDDGQLLLTLPRPGDHGHVGPVTAVAVSPDGAYLATAGLDLQIRIWNAVTGKPHETLSGHTASVTSLRFAPDQGGRLASSSVDASVKIWDYVRGKEVLTLLGHEQETTDAWFVLDNGLSVMSFSKDRTGIQWPAEPWKAPIAPATARASTPAEAPAMDDAANDPVR